MEKTLAHCAAAFTLTFAVLLFIYGDHIPRVCALNVLMFAAVSQFLGQDSSPTIGFVALLAAYIAMIFGIVGVFSFAL